MPMPITTEPRSWLAAVFGLMTLPTSNMPSQREILASPVSVSTRTSQSCAPRAAFDQRWSRRYLDRNLAYPASLPSRVPEPTAASMDGSPAAANVVAWLSPIVLVRRGERAQLLLQLVAGGQDTGGDGGGLGRLSRHRSGGEV
jgi:hypothetical protein